MSDHVFCRGYPFKGGAWIGRFTRNSLLEQCRDPRWTITERLDLLVLNEDGVAANPVIAANRAVQHFRIANPAVVRLSIGQERSFLKVLELDLEHVDPGPLGSLVIRERIVGERPGVTFTPEPVHEGIDRLDERIAIEFRGQLSYQFFECLLKKRIVIPGLITPMRVLQISLRR